MKVRIKPYFFGIIEIMTMGKLITFEGPDGAGKTTALKNILAALENRANVEVLTTREPGGIKLAEEIRELILDPEHTEIDGKTELLLFEAARRLHLQQKIIPALEAGKLVLVDRFIDSSVAYQGYGREIGAETVDWLNEFATDDIKPDLTLLFDIDTETGISRIMNNRADEVNRLDTERAEMHQKVRQGYLKLLEENPERFVKIDAAQDFEAVKSDSLNAILERFPGLFS